MTPVDIRRDSSGGDPIRGFAPAVPWTWAVL